MRIIIALSLCFLLHTGFASVFFEHNLIHNTQVAQGFETDNDLSRQSCLNKPDAPKYYGKWVLDDVLKNTDSRDVLMQLGLNTGMGPTYAVYNDSIASQFLQTVSQDQYSENFIYRTDIVLPSHVYEAPTSQPLLNTEGQQLLDKPQAFRNQCGDRYINELIYQSMLYITVQLHFFDADDKNKSGLDPHWDSKTLLQALPSHLAPLNSQGDITINVFQLGGHSKKLDTLASTLQCRFNDLTPCLKSLQNLFDYASSKTKNDFIKQFPSSTEQPIPADAPISDSISRVYNWLGIPVTSVANKLTPEIKGTRINIDLAFKPILGNIVRATYILSLKNLQPAYQQKINLLLEALKFNKSLYHQAGELCFTKLDECLANYQQIGKKLKPIDLSLLDKPLTEQQLTPTLS